MILGCTSQKEEEKTAASGGSRWWVPSPARCSFSGVLFLLGCLRLRRGDSFWWCSAGGRTRKGSSSFTDGGFPSAATAMEKEAASVLFPELGRKRVCFSDGRNSQRTGGGEAALFAGEQECRRKESGSELGLSRAREAAAVLGFVEDAADQRRRRRGFSPVSF